MKKIILFLVLAIVFVSACSFSEEEVIKQCVYLCQKYEGNLSNGPCLSDGNNEWNYNDWVCDVVHVPRNDIDNLEENQCSEFRNGNANHFVEVSNTDCEFVRKV